MTNKHTITALLGGLAVGLWACCAGGAQAGVLTKGDIVKLTRITGTTFGGASGGGEFALFKEISPSLWEQLDVPTYCVEFNEHISLGERLVVGAISDRAVAGGVGGGTPNGDILDPATQYLYASYATGAMATAVSGYMHDNTWSNALQRAIWYLENELGSATLASQSSKMQALVNFALTYGSYKGPVLGTVSVLNLFSIGAPISGFIPSDPSTWGPVASYRRQDQLFYKPPLPPSVRTVPEPTSGVIWLTACGLLAVCTRCRKFSRHY